MDIKNCKVVFRSGRSSVNEWMCVHKRPRARRCELLLKHYERDHSSGNINSSAPRRVEGEFSAARCGWRSRHVDLGSISGKGLVHSRDVVRYGQCGSVWTTGENPNAATGWTFYDDSLSSRLEFLSPLF